MAEQLSFLESISGLITKQKGRTLKYTDEVRRSVTTRNLRTVQYQTGVPIVLVLGAPAFAVFAFSVGVYEATHSQRFWVPIVMGLIVLALSYVVLVHEAIGMSRALQMRLEPVIKGFDMSIPLMTPMYPIGVALRLVELASEYNSLCKKRANAEVFVTRVVEETGLSREQALALPGADELRGSVLAANEDVERARVDFWKFVDTTYDEAATNFVVSTIQMPPRPKKWRDALALGPWIDQARADLYARLEAGNPEESVPPTT